MAYVLGFFAADGYLVYSRRKTNFFGLEICDKDLLIKIRRLLNSNHKLSARKPKEDQSPIFRIQIGSKKICNDLRRLGFAENKTHSLSVPNVPQKYFPHFVRCYFDGDGSVWTGEIHKERKKRTLAIRTVFTSCSGEFLLKLKERLYLMDVSGGVFSKGKGNYYRLTYSIHSSLKLYNFMYNHVILDNLFLKRKKRVFENYIKMRS